VLGVHSGPLRAQIYSVLVLLRAIIICGVALTPLAVGACGDDSEEDDSGAEPTSSELTQGGVEQCLEEEGLGRVAEGGAAVSAPEEPLITISASAPDDPERLIQIYYFGSTEAADAEFAGYQDLGIYPNTIKTGDLRGVIVSDFVPTTGQAGDAPVFAGEAALQAAVKCMEPASTGSPAG
jgi:hypothetical protein